MTENIQTKTPNNHLVPIAIVVGFGLVAGAVFMSNGKGKDTVVTAKTETNQLAQKEPVATTNSVRAVTKDDHIKGSLDAPVMIVEYSDYECPFCKRFHDTMNEVMKEVDDGQVAWVFRHFPLDQLHPVKARAVAVASECVSEQGGNESFWKFSDRYMELTLSNNKTPIETVIPQIVQEIGLNGAAFQTCFESGKFDQHIEDDIKNAIATGGRGTPWSVVIASNGKTFPLNGAQPPEAVKQLINLAAQEK